MRGLCNGLGPALFGLLFYLSHVQLESTDVSISVTTALKPHPLNISLTSQKPLTVQQYIYCLLLFIVVVYCL